MASDPHAQHVSDITPPLDASSADEPMSPPTEPCAHALRSIPMRAARDDEEAPHARSGVAPRRDRAEDATSDDGPDLALLLGMKRLDPPPLPREFPDARGHARSRSGGADPTTTETLDFDSILRSSVTSAPPAQVGSSGFWLTPPPLPSATSRNTIGRVVGGLAVAAALGGAFYAGTHVSRTEAPASPPRPAVVRLARAGVRATPAARAAEAPASVAPAEASPSAGLGAPLDVDDADDEVSVAPRERSPQPPAPTRASSTRARARASARAEAAPAAPLDAVPPAAPAGEASLAQAAPEGAAPAEVDQPSLDELMRGAIAAPADASPTERAAADPGPLPALPSRASLRSALSSVTPALRACTSHRGVAMMSITMSGEGGVLEARPVGAWASGAEAACVRSAVGGAHIPRFRQTRLTVHFPFVL
jgi:hypothetical protein